ncbi:hypothetical protein K435DRAFT_795705 [Dendrothele bispora CBS 962.96]|uniref:Uncharacterized protein n=1 Tax=Dendrothele bispora (strain CBS 962.96) TaxID=1314807 RepID=A0A4S8M7V8_DENBC|nr:hypothetical protein K435DRAFT_795705 [Dendrothele bispora CBS 962.96]
MFIDGLLKDAVKRGLLDINTLSPRKRMRIETGNLDVENKSELDSELEVSLLPESKVMDANSVPDPTNEPLQVSATVPTPVTSSPPSPLTLQNLPKFSQNDTTVENNSLEPLDKILFAKYQDHDLFYNLLEEWEEKNGKMTGHFELLNSSSDVIDPASVAMSQLIRDAGVSPSDFDRVNPVRRADWRIAAYLIHVANQLIRKGGRGSEKDSEELSSLIVDGKIMLDIAASLVDMQSDARAYLVLNINYMDATITLRVYWTKNPASE